MGDRAIRYRELNDIRGLRGTAVNVQAMVFGNMGDDSATGVAFTRDPSTGENVFYGEFLVNAQGEDVVAGIRTPLECKTEMGKWSQKSWKELLAVKKVLEAATRTCRTSSSRSRRASCTCSRPATASAPPRRPCGSPLRWSRSG
jgi:phosphoenolpyruvate synthase/pyruvate phosphate dikinase